MKVSKVVAIARREYIARVRSKGFIITTLLVPALMVLYAFLFPALTRADVDEIRITIVDAGTGIGDALATRLENIDSLPFELQSTETVSSRDIDDTRQRFSEAVRNDEIDGYIVLLPDDDTCFARRPLTLLHQDASQ